MLGAHALVGEDITLPACVTHAYAETHTLKYDVVRCSYRPTTGLPTKALTAPPPTKRKMGISHIAPQISNPQPLRKHFSS